MAFRPTLRRWKGIGAAAAVSTATDDCLFLDTGNPNATGLPSWPAHTSADSVLKLLTGASATFNADSAHPCSFRKSLGLAR